MSRILDLLKPQQSKSASSDQTFTVEQMLSEMDLPGASIWIRHRQSIQFGIKYPPKKWYCEWDRSHDGAKLEIRGGDHDTMIEAVRACYNKMRAFGVLK